MQLNRRTENKRELIISSYIYFLNYTRFYIYENTYNKLVSALKLNKAGKINYRNTCIPYSIPLTIPKSNSEPDGVSAIGGI